MKTHPHNPKRQPLPARKPIIHEQNRRRIRQTRSNAIRNALRENQMRRGSRERTQSQRQTHDHKAHWRRPAPETRQREKNAKVEWEENIRYALWMISCVHRVKTGK